MPVERAGDPDLRQPVGAALEAPRCDPWRTARRCSRGRVPRRTLRPSCGPASTPVSELSEIIENYRSVAESPGLTARGFVVDSLCLRLLVIRGELGEPDQ